MKQSEQQRERSLSKIDALETRYVARTPPLERRSGGVTFTPQWVVDLMLRRIARLPFTTVIDAGAGAGRFTLAAARRFPGSRVIAIENDTALASGLRRLIHTDSLESRVTVMCSDFLECPLPSSGRRLFLGNPPYVRHHSLSSRQKAWLQEIGGRLAKQMSGLSGLHVYFLARILREARAGDALLMILPSEWLETRYGAAIKAAILERARAVRLLLFDSKTQVFEGAMTTSVILELEFGGPTREFEVTLVDDKRLSQANPVNSIQLPARGGESANWLTLAWNALSPHLAAHTPADAGVELGEIFEVHRGQVTGKNGVWIATPQTESLIPRRFLYPCVTDAKEIFALEDGVLASTESLRRVIDLPHNLELLESEERENVEHFLHLAKRAGAANGYIAQHRRSWWKVGLRNPPAIIMTYMARQAPRFALNGAGARLINIAHGLYPKQTLSQAQLLGIVRWLNANTSTRNGRTYAGGLIKLEPGDASRICVPDPRLFELAA